MSAEDFAITRFACDLGLACIVLALLFGAAGWVWERLTGGDNNEEPEE